MRINIATINNKNYTFKSVEFTKVQWGIVNSISTTFIKAYANHEVNDDDSVYVEIIDIPLGGNRYRNISITTDPIGVMEFLEDFANEVFEKAFEVA